MKFRFLILCAALLCIAATASAAPKSDHDDAARGANGNGNGLGHAYGHLKKGDLVESAASALKVTLVDLPRGGAKGPKYEHGPGDGPYGGGKLGGGPYWGPGPVTRPPTGGDVAAMPEPSGALLFGVGVGLLAARLRRGR
jgi:hypothetical protein